MTSAQYIIALDQGTTSSRSVLFDSNAQIVDVTQKEFSQYYPQSGWVEHDPMEILNSQLSTLHRLITRHGLTTDNIASLGITNQRETTIVWHKDTGKPIYNAIVWQCRRTSDLCEQLKQEGWHDPIQQSTGLILDPYFSATKVAWILDNVDGARALAEQGKLLFGTVDTWLIWHLTQGKVHATDFTNASRTMMFNINTLEWDDKILKRLNIPKSMLPQVQDSASYFGRAILDTDTPMQLAISGVAGDQQAALFGHQCVSAGQTKNTYGTGCFLLMNTGQERVNSSHGLLTTLAINAQGKPCYALEGAVFMAGASIQWLRDELRLLSEAKDSEYFANKVDSSNGVYVVPAFTGLGAPYWNPYARGTIVGLSRGTSAEHIVRATLESIAYQTCDVINAMQADANITLQELKVDGGAASNNFLMQFQADVLNTQVLRPQMTEVTAIGAAFLSGLASGFWNELSNLKPSSSADDCFTPDGNNDKRHTRYQGWQRAIKAAQAWSE
ncbi:glycerol kinase GlpK [Paraferrimonas haliotis]|uniref:Glycerol kinase n=1 Tax=Paraferrimonas haliotis TaxID=2013866 RepID=A0AA37TU72_9GAMM|nr:glycerol kinase GlpK [Paraferrimonas haliotis]GLS83019.1 glycerol kinase [Paraferrimonas haliotis]